MRQTAIINYQEAPVPVILTAKAIIEKLEKLKVEPRDIATELKTVESQIKILKDLNQHLIPFNGDYKYHALPKIVRHLTLEFYIKAKDSGFRTKEISAVCGINALNALNWNRLYKQLSNSKELLTLDDWGISVVDHYNSIKNLTI